MSTSKKKDIVRGKRYTPDEKSKIVAFVADYNATNGRGGQSAAAAKFGTSQLTIATWLKNAGMKPGGKSGAKGSMQNKLSTMLSLGNDIEKLDRELKAKLAKFEALKSSL